MIDWEILRNLYVLYMQLDKIIKNHIDYNFYYFSLSLKYQEDELSEETQVINSIHSNLERNINYG